MLAAAALAAGVAAYSIFRLEQLAPSKPSILSQIADAELGPQLRALAEQGIAGLTDIVESLSSERAALRAAAARVLHEEIEHSAKTTGQDAAQRLDRLAALLAAKAPQFKGDALAIAAAIAERLVAIVPATGKPHSERLRNCHVVLAAHAQEQMRHRDRSIAAQTGRHGQNAGAARRLTANDSDDSNTAFQAVPPDAAETIIDFAPLAGGGLPIVPAQSKPIRLPEGLIAEAKPLRSANSGIARPAATITSNTRAGDRSAQSVVASAGDQTIAAFDDDPRTMAPPTGRAVQPAAASWPAASPARDAPDCAAPLELTQLLDLERRLRAKDGSVTAAAKEELKRLRVDEMRLKLARGAVDPDPQVRREVVEALPLIGSVDARGWILWLSHDRDAEVRRAAISLLATASDPELKKRVREAAASDPDPRVREEARAAALGVR